MQQAMRRAESRKGPARFAKGATEWAASELSMDNDWRLRRAAQEDAELIAAIFASSRRAAMPYLPVLYADAEVLRWIMDTVLRNSVVTLAVSDDGQAGGFASVSGGVLEHLYVSPHLQGRGLGTLLLAAARRESPHGLRLHVFQRNLAARRFYERRGFRLVELRDGSANEEGEPDAVYEWRSSGPQA
jgi:ribosomal protein S18 acetylase RimI-like enzyme